MRDAVLKKKRKRDPSSVVKKIPEKLKFEKKNQF